MNSLKKGERVPPLNFVGGPGVPLLNFRGVLGPTFKLWGGSRGPGLTFTPCPALLLMGTISKTKSHGKIRLYVIKRLPIKQLLVQS